jgi:NADH-quinone oxidoreductase subunit M
MANAGLPGTSGFVGEFLVILSAFKASFWYAFFAATTLILGAAYTLWMYKRVIFGEVTNAAVGALQDLSLRETCILLALAISVLVLGLWPAPLFDMMHASVEQLVEHISHSKPPL